MFMHQVIILLVAVIMLEQLNGSVLTKHHHKVWFYLMEFVSLWLSFIYDNLHLIWIIVYILNAMYLTYSSILVHLGCGYSYDVIQHWKLQISSVIKVI